MVCATAVWQTSILWLIGEHLFSPLGWEHVAVITSAAGISDLVACLDRSIFIQASYRASGIRTLRKAGISNFNGEGLAATGKSLAAFAVRGTLSAVSSTITGILAGLVLYGADIQAERAGELRAMNAPVVQMAERRVDAEISQAANAVRSEQAKIDDLATQEGAIRAKWKLASDYPMVAPNYSATRSALARSNGLGRKPAVAVAKPARKSRNAAAVV